MTDTVTPAAPVMLETQGWRKRAFAGKAKLQRNAQMAELRAIRAAHIAQMDGIAPVEEPAPEGDEQATQNSDADAQDGDAADQGTETPADAATDAQAPATDSQTPAPAPKTGRRKAAAEKAQ